MKLKNLSVVKQLIQYEKTLRETLKSAGLTFQNEDSPLDISFLDESFALMGIPEEFMLNHLKNHDPLVDIYVAMSYGDVSISKGLNQIQKLVAKEEAVAYNPQTNPDTNFYLIYNYLVKMVNLKKSLNTLNVNENSVLNPPDLTSTLTILGLSEFNDDVVEDIYNVINIRKKQPLFLMRKYVAPKFKVSA